MQSRQSNMRGEQVVSKFLPLVPKHFFHIHKSVAEKLFIGSLPTIGIALQWARSLINIMTSSNITIRSSKADIVQASEELIGDLDERLTKEVRLTSNLKEERTTLVYLVVFTSTIALLF